MLGSKTIGVYRDCVCILPRSHKLGYCLGFYCLDDIFSTEEGAHQFSGSVLDSRPGGGGAGSTLTSVTALIP